MSEHPRTPDANIEALIERMRQAARLYRALPQPSAADASDHAVREAASHLDSYLAELMRRSQPRSELPHRFRRFPFTIAPIGRLALRLYNLLTKDQRDVNLLLRDALQALQAALAHGDKSARENGILRDYIRAQLGYASRSSNEVKSAEAPSAQDLDAFFVALGDRFRGAPELITDRLRVYLPIVQSAGLSGPALDLGCGRGEWLDLLRAAGIEAVGVEQNRLLIAECERKGLRVIEGDLCAFLDQSPPDHWNIVTAFHVIEHLDWPAWLFFLRRIHRVLQTGGLIILETPNPGNLVTATNRFYLDPTHRHPLPDPLLQFAASNVGFHSIQIVPLHADLENPLASELAGTEPALVRYLFGSEDYAVVARK